MFASQGLTDTSSIKVNADLFSGLMYRDLRRVPRSKLNPPEFIDGFDLLAIASIHGETPTAENLKTPCFSAHLGYLVATGNGNRGPPHDQGRRCSKWHP